MQMSHKRAFLVLGGISCGTRLMTQWLIATGCDGDGNHTQRWDVGITSESKLLVWGRSFPHFKERLYTDINGMYTDLIAAKYTDIHAVVITRDWNAAAQSAVKRREHTESTEDAIRDLRLAYKHIYSGIGGVYTMVSYEALTSYPKQYSSWLSKQLQLPFPKGLQIDNKNQKYY